jgi:hypothetical protein
MFFDGMRDSQLEKQLKQLEKSVQSSKLIELPELDETNQHLRAQEKILDVLQGNEENWEQIVQENIGFLENNEVSQALFSFLIQKKSQMADLLQVEPCEFDFIEMLKANLTDCTLFK